MSLQDSANKVAIPGHKGSHPPPYHMAVMIQLLLSVFTAADANRASQIGLDAMIREKLDKLLKNKDDLAKFREQCADSLRSALEDLKAYLLEHPELVRGDEWYQETNSPEPNPTKKE
jgi:hypothetical protein